MRRRSSVEGVDIAHEEKEQCRRSRHSSGGEGAVSKESTQLMRRRRSSVEGVDAAHEEEEQCVMGMDAREASVMGKDAREAG